MLKTLISFVFLFLISIEVFAKPKVLIFYSYGGHKSASAAIAERVKARHPDAEVKEVDFGEMLTGARSFFWDNGYPFVIRYMPTMFEAIDIPYANFAARESDFTKYPIKYFLNIPEVTRVINEEKPDVILTTHFLFTDFLNMLRHNGLMKSTPLGWLHTDLVDNMRFARLTTGIDKTFVGHPSIKEAWIQRGIPEDRLAVSGISVRDVTQQRFGDSELFRFAKEKGIRRNRTTVSLIGGSMGALPYKSLIRSIQERSETGIDIIAFVGGNEKAKRQLEKIAARENHFGVKLRDNVRLTVLGKVPQDELMKYIDVSSFAVTKPGGLSTFEFSFRQTPIIFLDMIGAHEGENARIATESGYGMVTKRPDDVGKIIAELRTSRGRTIVKKMLASQKRFSELVDTDVIVDWIMNATAKEPMPPDSVKLNDEDIQDANPVLEAIFKWNLYWSRPDQITLDCLRMELGGEALAD